MPFGLWYRGCTRRFVGICFSSCTIFVRPCAVCGGVCGWWYSRVVSRVCGCENRATQCVINEFIASQWTSQLELHGKLDARLVRPPLMPHKRTPRWLRLHDYRSRTRRGAERARAAARASYVNRPGSPAAARPSQRFIGDPDQHKQLSASGGAAEK